MENQGGLDTLEAPPTVRGAVSLRLVVGIFSGMFCSSNNVTATGAGATLPGDHRLCKVPITSGRLHHRLM